MTTTTKFLSAAVASVLIGGSGLIAASPVMAAPGPTTVSVPSMTMGQMTITITDFEYSGTGTITPGSVINVVNNDALAHTVTAENGAFDITIPAGETATFTAPAEGGTYAFFCTIHPSMKGSLTVQEGASTPMPAESTPSTTPAPAPAEPGMAEMNQPAPMDQAEGTEQMKGMDQMGAVPEGGADTGVETVAENPTGAIALGGGLLLIALAGSIYTVRKRPITG